ncbi:hypothetical protein RhiJN_11027 [Ceratobasidium sp. AG-Ba]|nr:hypothetical protein RhiJN_11027 [Ceratobasidium sp. AG-Ba]
MSQPFQSIDDLRAAATALGFFLQPSDEAPPYAPSANPAMGVAKEKDTPTPYASPAYEGQPQDTTNSKRHARPKMRPAPSKSVQDPPLSEPNSVDSTASVPIPAHRCNTSTIMDTSRSTPPTNGPPSADQGLTAGSAALSRKSTRAPDTVTTRGTARSAALRGITPARGMAPARGGAPRGGVPRPPASMGTTVSKSETNAAPCAPSRINASAPLENPIATDVTRPTDTNTPTPAPVEPSSVDPRSSQTSQTAPSKRVASRRCKPASGPYPAISKTQSDALFRELKELRAPLERGFHIKILTERPSGSPNRGGEYNLETSFELTPDAYWIIREVMKHALSKYPGFVAGETAGGQRIGFVRKVVNFVAPVFPELDPYQEFDYYILVDFAQSILRSAKNVTTLVSKGVYFLFWMRRRRRRILA